MPPSTPYLPIAPVVLNSDPNPPTRPSCRCDCRHHHHHHQLHQHLQSVVAERTLRPPPTASPVTASAAATAFAFGTQCLKTLPLLHSTPIAVSRCHTGK